MRVVEVRPAGPEFDGLGVADLAVEYGGGLPVFGQQLIVGTGEGLAAGGAQDVIGRYLAERADLLGAIRLPQTAFEQNAGTEVVEAKAGGGSATLSMGQAACRFGLSLIKGLQGEANVIECAYVEGNGEHATFFIAHEACCCTDKF